MFAQRLLFYGQPGEPLFCQNPFCEAEFRIDGGNLRLVNGAPRCVTVAEKIRELKRISLHFESLDPAKREDLDMQLRDLENELSDFELGS